MAASPSAWARRARPFLLLAVLCACTLAWPLSDRRAAAQTPSQVGQWGAVQTWPIVSVHTHLMPNGLVLFWDYSGNTRLWNPATAAITTPAQPGRNTFCSGNCFLADGRVFVPGGHIENNVGLPSASCYNPATGAWTANPNMNAGRWYPSATLLGSGDVLVHSGDSQVGQNNDLPQVYQAATNSWRDLTTARLAMTLYPRTFLAPNGQVFFATNTSRYLNTSGTGAWTTVGTKRNPGTDNYGPAAMYDVGKILYAGGADPPTANAETIDLNAPTPAWSQVAPMPQARRQNNATILPDGKVLVTGGSASSGFNTVDGGKAALLWNPASNSWTTLATESQYRGYHSCATLLPDGRVLSSGGDNQPNAQVFSPPYLFNGARPAISSAPASVSLGQTFFVGTPDGPSVTRVTITAPGSETHAFNWHQRINILNFSQAAGGLNVTVPSSANACPPGYYMLWLINSSDVPSVAAWVRVNGADAGSYSLTAAPATVAAGGPLKVNWTAPAGRPSTDWIGLYRVGEPNQLYLWWQYTGGAASGSFNLTAPGEAGQYHFRYLQNNGFTSVATSNAVTVTGGGTFSLTASPETAAAGDPLTVKWTAPAGRPSTDWIALYRVGNPNTSYGAWFYTGGAASGSQTVTAPGEAGQYHFRYLQNNGFTSVAASNAVTVTGEGAYSLTASPATVAAGGQLKVDWTAPAGRPASDWIALYRVGDPNQLYVWWQYTAGATSGSVTLTAPLGTGRYEFRYLQNNGYTSVATSNTVTVQ